MVFLSSKPKDGVIGFAATWNALPRKPVIAHPTQSVYVEAVRHFLKVSGIADPKGRITRMLRVNLDGDGEEEEVLISATNYFATTNRTIHPPLLSLRRQFMLRSVELIPLSLAARSRWDVQTKLVAGEVYAKPDESVAPNVFNLAAAFDLNGDGKLQVIVHSFYYERGQTTIYRCEPDKIEAVLSVEYGA